MKVSEDYSLSMAGFQRQMKQALEYARDKKWSAAWHLASRLQDRIEQFKWFCRERMDEDAKL